MSALLRERPATRLGRKCNSYYRIPTTFRLPHGLYCASQSISRTRHQSCEFVEEMLVPMTRAATRIGEVVAVAASKVNSPGWQVERSDAPVTALAVLHERASKPIARASQKWPRLVHRDALRHLRSASDIVETDPYQAEVIARRVEGNRAHGITIDFPSPSDGAERSRLFKQTVARKRADVQHHRVFDHARVNPWTTHFHAAAEVRGAVTIFPKSSADSRAER